MSGKKMEVLFDMDDFKVHGNGGVVGTTYRGRMTRTEYSCCKFRSWEPDVGTRVGILDYGFIKPEQIEAIGIVVGVKGRGKNKEYDVWVCAADPLEYKSVVCLWQLAEREEKIPVGVKKNIPGQCVVFFRDNVIERYSEKYGLDTDDTRAKVEATQDEFKRAELKKKQEARRKKTEERKAKKLKTSED